MRILPGRGFNYLLGLVILLSAWLIQGWSRHYPIPAGVEGEVFSFAESMNQTHQVSHIPAEIESKAYEALQRIDTLRQNKHEMGAWLNMLANLSSFLSLVALCILLLVAGGMGMLPVMGSPDPVHVGHSLLKRLSPSRARALVGTLAAAAVVGNLLSVRLHSLASEYTDRGHRLTKTMLSGRLELYRVTDEQAFRDVLFGLESIDPNDP